MTGHCARGVPAAVTADQINATMPNSSRPLAEADRKMLRSTNHCGGADAMNIANDAWIGKAA